MPSPSEPATVDQVVSVPASAVEVITRWIADDPRSNLGLRISVVPGGCSGYRYEVRLDPSRHDDDLVDSGDGVDVLLDSQTVPYLRGAIIDYAGSRFTIDNPNARGACMCGASFTLTPSLKRLV